MVKKLNFLALVVVLSLTGCQNPPKDYVIAAGSLSYANETLIKLHDEGLVDQEEFAQAYRKLRSARRILELAHDDLPEGGENFKDHLSNARRLISDVREVLNDSNTDSRSG